MGTNCSCHVFTHERLGDHPSDFCDHLATTVSERIGMSERSGMASGKAAGIGGGAACGIDSVRMLILASGKAAVMGGGAACGFRVCVNLHPRHHCLHGAKAQPNKNLELKR